MSALTPRPSAEVVPNSLRAMLHERIEAGSTPEEAAEEVMASAEREAIAELALPNLIVMARRIQRDVARRAEVLTRADMDELGIDAASAARKHLVDQKFALPDGTWVEWAYATHNQHIERATWMRQHAEASIKDAELHEQAAALIHKHKAKCLAETPSYSKELGA